ncbi:MAG: 30S ribosome-binding factor RbfA, partial [Pseudomonadota bacterium]
MAQRKNHQQRGKGPSQRQLKAGELIRHALVEILQRDDFRDPLISSHPVTISEVRMAPDLRQGTAFCTSLGGSLDGSDDNALIHALNKVQPAIRKALGAKITMKFTPEITFRRDESFDEAERINRLLAR